MNGRWKIRGVFQALPLLAAFWTGSLPWIGAAIVYVLTVEVLWIDALFGSRFVSFSRSASEQIDLWVHAAKEVPGIGWPLRAMLSAREKSMEIEEGEAAQETADQILSDFEAIVFDDFGLKRYSSGYDNETVTESVIDQTELVKETCYPLIAAAIFDGHDSKFRNAVLVAVFCREQVRIKESNAEIIYTGERASAFREGVKEALSEFDFKSPGPHERKLLQTFDVLTPAIESGKQLDSMEIFQDNVNDPEEIFDRLTRGYTAIDFDITYREDDWTHINSRILDVVYRGELNAERVKNDIDQIIQQEFDRLTEEQKQRQAFLLCYKSITTPDSDGFGEFQERLKTQFQDWIYIGTKYAPDEQLANNGDAVAVSMHVVFPKKRYASTEDFYTTAIRPISPENLFVTASEVSVAPFYSDRQREALYATADEDADVDLVFDFTDYLVTHETRRSIMAEALDNLINHRIDISELLRALPLNVFVPYIREDEEKVFTKNQDTIEERLGITEFADWGRQDVERVAKALNQVDEAEVSNRWGRIAKDVVREVDRCTL